MSNLFEEAERNVCGAPLPLNEHENMTFQRTELYVTCTGCKLAISLSTKPLSKR